jgi:hypothetical protein
MDPKRRREVALGAIAILLLVVVAWSLQRDSTPTEGGNAAATTSANNPQARAKNPVIEVDLKALETVRPEPKEGTRNPFRFRPKPAPPQPSAAVIRQQQQQQAEAAMQAPQVPVGPPPPPRIPLKYIGDMVDPKHPGKRIAILSDARGVYHGGENEVIEGRYRIIRIGVESIELAYLDGRGRQTIRQTGQ